MPTGSAMNEQLVAWAKATREADFGLNISVLSLILLAAPHLDMDVVRQGRGRWEDIHPQLGTAPRSPSVHMHCRLTLSLPS
jgi:hypothetical protein